MAWNRPRDGGPIRAKLTLKLADLRVRSFDTTGHGGNAHGAARAADGGECGECTGCTELTGCSDCTACTWCTWPTCIHTGADGGACQPGTAR